MSRAEPTFTIPNIVTAVRILMALLAATMFAACVAEKLAVALCILASILDAFDGWFARTFSQCSNLGKQLDPIADKIVIAVIYSVIALKTGSVLIWMLSSLIFFRELIITLLRTYALRCQIAALLPSRLGKLKMVVQAVAGNCIIVYAYFVVGGFSFPIHAVAAILLVIVAITYASGLQYLISWKIQHKPAPGRVLDVEFPEEYGESERLVMGK